MSFFQFEKNSELVFFLQIFETFVLNMNLFVFFAFASKEYFVCSLSGNLDLELYIWDRCNKLPREKMCVRANIKVW